MCALEEKKSHLADVHVGAVGVDLRVVSPEHGGVDGVVGDDLVAGVAALDDVGRLAVLALVAQAEALAGLEVVTGAVDLRVCHRELVAKACGSVHGSGRGRGTRRVRGDVLVGRDAVTDIAILDGVGARTVGGGGGCTCHLSTSTMSRDLHGGGRTLSKERERDEGSNDRAGEHGFKQSGRTASLITNVGAG